MLVVRLVRLAGRGRLGRDRRGARRTGRGVFCSSQRPMKRLKNRNVMMTQRKKLPPTFMSAPASCWSSVTLMPQSRGPWS